MVASLVAVSRPPSPSSRPTILASLVLAVPFDHCYPRAAKTTVIEWHADRKLHLDRLDRMDEQISGLVLSLAHVQVVCEKWQDALLHLMMLPQLGTSRLWAQRMPDGGLQFTRCDPQGFAAKAFRIYAADVPSFLAFIRHWVLRLTH